MKKIKVYDEYRGSEYFVNESDLKELSYTNAYEINPEIEVEFAKFQEYDELREEIIYYDSEELFNELSQDDLVSRLEDLGINVYSKCDADEDDTRLYIR